jgi:hypothetical protein
VGEDKKQQAVRVLLCLVNYRCSAAPGSYTRRFPRSTSQIVTEYGKTVMDRIEENELVEKQEQR